MRRAKVKIAYSFYVRIDGVDIPFIRGEVVEVNINTLYGWAQLVNNGKVFLLPQEFEEIL